MKNPKQIELNALLNKKSTYAKQLKKLQAKLTQPTDDFSRSFIEADIEHLTATMQSIDKQIHKLLY